MQGQRVTVQDPLSAARGDLLSSQRGREACKGAVRGGDGGWTSTPSQEGRTQVRFFF